MLENPELLNLHARMKHPEQQGEHKVHGGLYSPPRILPRVWQTLADSVWCPAESVALYLSVVFVILSLDFVYFRSG